MENELKDLQDSFAIIDLLTNQNKSNTLGNIDQKNAFVGI